MQPYNINPYVFCPQTQNNQNYNTGYPQSQPWDQNNQYQNTGGFSQQPTYGQQPMYGQQPTYGQQPMYGQDPYANNFSNNSFDGFSIPDDFIIKEKLLTIGMDMKLQHNDGSQFGFIKQKVLSIGRTFQLEDSSGRVVATAKEKLLTIGRDFEIVDSSGSKIGSIVEQVLKSMLSIHRKYTVRNSSGAVIGSTKQLDLLNKGSIQILNSFGSSQAKFSQSWGSFIKQKWNVKFFGNNIDRRLLIFFPSISSQRQEEKSFKTN